MKGNEVQTETIQVKTQLLQQLLKLTDAMVQGEYTQRIVTGFDDDLITHITDNLNQLSDKIQLNRLAQADNQTQAINSFIEVISSFANLDFKQKLPISENGTILDAIATGINILGEELEQSTTSKKELEVERNRLHEAQAIAKVGSWELDVGSLDLSWSDEAYRIFELQLQQKGDLFEAYRQKIHPDDLPQLDQAINHAIIKAAEFVLELRMIAAGESIKYILCIGEPLKDNKNRVVRLKGTIQDITERKRIEQTLKEAKEYAEEANSAKSRFLANMSHEIRTPLNGILGLTEIMLGEEVSEEHRSYLNIVRDSGKNLAQLINDILDLSKIESKKLHLENIAFNFTRVINSTVNSYKFLADQKGLSLTCFMDESIPVEVMGDPTRISQIVTNLISNAIKFTEKGKIEISFKLMDKSADRIVIQGAIKDTGVGIPQDKLGTVFQSFTQADESITRKYGGTGLGLSIVKNLLQQMGGSITVKSPVDLVANNGTVFIFNLDLVLTAKRDKVEPFKNSNADVRQFNKPVTILVVDDNPVNLLVAKKMLKKFGANVVIAESGEEAISLIPANDFDLILMDIQMPELNGYETAGELRRLNYQKPIIALSANAYEEDVQKSLSFGMNDHIKKPYSEEHLFEKVSHFLE